MTVQGRHGEHLSHTLHPSSENKPMAMCTPTARLRAGDRTQGQDRGPETGAQERMLPTCCTRTGLPNLTASGTCGRKPSAGIWEAPAPSSMHTAPPPPPALDCCNCGPPLSLPSSLPVKALQQNHLPSPQGLSPPFPSHPYTPDSLHFLTCSQTHNGERKTPVPKPG